MVDSFSSLQGMQKKFVSLPEPLSLEAPSAVHCPPLWVSLLGQSPLRFSSNWALVIPLFICCTVYLLVTFPHIHFLSFITPVIGNDFLLGLRFWIILFVIDPAVKSGFGFLFAAPARTLRGWGGVATASEKDSGVSDFPLQGWDSMWGEGGGESVTSVEGWGITRTATGGGGGGDRRHLWWRVQDVCEGRRKILTEKWLL